MAYRDTVLADSPVAYYRLDEGSGAATMLDSSGNGRSGAYLNGAVPSATSLLLSEPTDSALTLDGVDDYASVPYAAWMTPTTAFSAEFWFRPTTTAGNHFLVGRGNYSTSFGNTWTWHFHQSGTTLQMSVFTGDSGTLTTINASVALVANTTYHVVGTFDGSTMRLYINAGTPVTGGRVGTMNTAPNINLTFGACHQSTVAERLQGTLDEVAIYHAVLSPTQIAAHYSAGSTPTVTAAPSGAGALTASGQVYRQEGAAAPSGTGALTATGQVYRQQATAAFGGGGDLAAEAGVQIQTATAALGGASMLASSGAVGAQDSSAEVHLASQGALQARGELVLPQGGIRRWIFYDPGTHDLWQVPINPNSMDSPYAPRNMAMAHGSRLGPDRIRAIDNAPSGPGQWTFGGVIRTKNHHDQLAAWASKNTTIQITDHLGRTFEVVIQTFDPVDRRPMPLVPWRLTFKMTCLVLREIK